MQRRVSDPRFPWYRGFDPFPEDMTMTKKSSLSKAELEDLKAAGYVEGNKHTIPENLSPVLKATLLREVEGDVDPLDHDADGRKGGHVDNRGKAVKK